MKADLEMLRNDGLGPEDSQTALKQRLLDLTKKNRRLQVAGDGWWKACGKMTTHPWPRSSLFILHAAERNPGGAVDLFMTWGADFENKTHPIGAWDSLTH